MSLTRSFDATVRARLQRDPKFRSALLSETLRSLVAGDFATAKIILRDYVGYLLS
jgi:hypothetical protein